MRIFPILIAAAVAMVPLAAVPAQEATQTEKVLGRVFSDIERQVIEEYYRNRGKVKRGEHGDNRHAAGRGHKKNKNKYAAGRGSGGRGLPPGLEMQLHRYGRLPPGLEKRTLPDGLLARLGKRHGTERQLVGSDVLLVDTATGIILDILRNAANP